MPYLLVFTTHIEIRIHQFVYLLVHLLFLPSFWNPLGTCGKDADLFCALLYVYGIVSQQKPGGTIMRNHFCVGVVVCFLLSFQKSLNVVLYALKRR